MKDNLGRPYEMVRGLCPRNCIRWAVGARMAHRWKRGCYRSGHTAAPNSARQSRDGGAPGTVRPTGCVESISAEPTSSVIQRKGRRGRRPLRGVHVGMFQRSREVQFSTHVTFYAASPVTLPPVGGGVLDAPWSLDCRAALDASIRPDRLHPRLIRCASLASNAQRFQSRGRSPRTISYGRPRLSVIPGRAGVEARPYEAWVRGTDAVSQPANGAPRTVRPTTCGKVSA